MKRVQEIIHIVPEKREAYLNYHLNLSKESQQVLWLHGIRNQVFFDLNGLILETFEYVGHNFKSDMAIVSGLLAKEGFLVEKRRRDVPAGELETTNWWAPIKRIGEILAEDPFPGDDAEEELSQAEQYRSIISGYMEENDIHIEVGYDEDDWSESVHI